MQYFPQRANPAQWQVIRQFVAACVLDYRPRTAQVAGDLMSTLTHYVLWAVSEAHASLDRDDLFYPMMIRRYINAIARTASSKRNYASRLYRIANVIGGPPTSPAQPPPTEGTRSGRTPTANSATSTAGFQSGRPQRNDPTRASPSDSPAAQASAPTKCSPSDTRTSNGQAPGSR